MKKGFVLLVFIAALSIVLIAPASAQIEFIEPTASAADETARDVSPEFAGIVADLAARLLLVFYPFIYIIEQRNI